MSSEGGRAAGLAGAGEKFERMASADINQAAMDSRPVGSEIDFSRVFAEWFDYVWLLLQRLGVRSAEVDDVLQEVFLVVHRRLSDYDPTRPMRPWLTGITVRVARRERRLVRHHREQLTESDQLGRMLVEHETPEASLAARQRRQRVHEALDALDDDRRAIFTMRDLHGIPCPEIAEILDLPVNTVYTRLRTARQLFKQAFARLGLAGGDV